MLAAAAAAAGCGSADPEDLVRKANETNLQKLGSFYLLFQRENGWQGPADEAVFKEFITTYSPQELERIGVDPSRVDELFVSERDGEPFLIRYGVPGSPLGSTAAVVFEATGDGTKRRIAFLDMVQADVETEIYDKLWAGETVDGVGAPKRR